MKIIEGKKIAIRLLGLLSFCFLSMAVAKGEDTSNGLTVSDEGKCLTINSDEGFKSLENIDISNVIKITIGNQVTKIPYAIFYQKNQITEVQFEENSQLITIEDFTFQETSITQINIPASVETIGLQAFNSCTGLESVTFEEGSALTTIGVSAFQSTAIKNLQIPASVETIKESAFYSCTSLESVIFDKQSKLKEIGNFAFGASKISTFEYPTKVGTIGNSIFYNCSELKSITFEEGSKIKTIDESFINENVVSITIPASVTTIDTNTFYYCPGLSEVVFEEGSLLEKIEQYTFYNTNIESIEIPVSVKTIEESAFGYCGKLTEVKFGKNSQLQTIGKNAFYGTGIESIEIPASVKTVGENVFGECDNLTEVKFNENSQLEIIGISAFQGKNIQSVEIPASVKTIKEQAFYQCKNLTEVKFADNSQLETIEKLAFEETPVAAIEFPQTIQTIGEQAFCNCSKLSNVVFKKDDNQKTALKTIGARAFYGLPVKIMELPPSIETIDDNAFGQCTNLERVILTGKETIPTIGTDLFEGMDSQPPICFPLEKSNEYEYILGNYSQIPGYCQTIIKQPEEGTLIIMVKGRQLNNEDRIFEDESLSAINDLDADRKIKVSVAVSYKDGYDNCDIYANDEKISVGDYEVSGDVTFRADNFTVKKVKVNISQPENGALTVFNKDAEVHDEDEIDYGTELTIDLTASSGYQGGTIKVNGSEIAGNTYIVQEDVTITAEGISKIPDPPYVPDPPYAPVYYTVSLPAVEGVTTDPAAGDYEVESWDSFRFYLTLAEGYKNDSHPIVTTDRGETIQPRTSDGAYLIKYVRQDVVISISGIVPDIPTGITDLDTDICIRVANGTLLISVPQTANAFVTDISGRILRTLRLVPGTTRVEGLHSGIYIVKIAGQEGRKVIVN